METSEGCHGVGCEPKGQHISQLRPQRVESRVEGGVGAGHIFVICDVLQSRSTKDVPEFQLGLEKPSVSCGAIVRWEIDPVTVFGGAATVSGGRAHLVACLHKNESKKY